jgi:hypothetical protein
MPPSSPQDLQSLIHRFLASLEDAENRLAAQSSCLSILQEHAAVLMKATSLLEPLVPQMAEASQRLHQAHRLSRRRIWIQATAVSLATSLLLLLTLTWTRPTWALREDDRRQLQLGRTIELLYQEMPPSDRQRLLELLPLNPPANPSKPSGPASTSESRVPSRQSSRASRLTR